MVSANKVARVAQGGLVTPVKNGAVRIQGAKVHDNSFE
jgi:hypothetical protein